MSEKALQKQSERVLVYRLKELLFSPLDFWFLFSATKKENLAQNFFSSLAPRCLLRKLFFHPLPLLSFLPSPPPPTTYSSTMREVISLHIGQAGTWNVKERE